LRFDPQYIVFTEYSLKLPDALRDPFSHLLMDAGALLWGLKWSELKLITYLYLVPKLRMSGSLLCL